jgi:Mg2+-importing ATPase
VVCLSFAGIVVLTMIPFTSAAQALKLARLPGIYFAWLALIVVCYMVFATVLKRVYIKRYGELL